MRRRIVFLSFLLLSPGFIHAVPNDRAELRLKDGRLLAGSLQPRTRRDLLQIQTEDGVTQIVPTRDIERLEVGGLTGKRSGFTSFLYSLILPGTGQRYCGYKTKGNILTGLWAASLAAMCADLAANDGEDTLPGIAFYIGYLTWGLTCAVNLIDAPLSASLANDKIDRNPYGYLIGGVTRSAGSDATTPADAPDLAVIDSNKPLKRYNPGHAGLLSAILPGAGQYTNHDYAKGVLQQMMLVTGIGLIAHNHRANDGLPGPQHWRNLGLASVAVSYLWSVPDAYYSAKAKNKRRGIALIPSGGALSTALWKGARNETIPGLRMTWKF